MELPDKVENPILKEKQELITQFESEMVRLHMDLEKHKEKLKKCGYEDWESRKTIQKDIGTTESTIKRIEKELDNLIN